jgi:hypothetical protein
MKYRVQSAEYYLLNVWRISQNLKRTHSTAFTIILHFSCLMMQYFDILWLLKAKNTMALYNQCPAEEEPPATITLAHRSNTTKVIHWNFLARQRYDS